jgi:DNA polymerase III sliding clamp (beta) subunit (PCNA family)
MKIDRKFKIESAATRDESRSYTDPWLDVASRLLVATDGHILAAVPVEVEEGERSRFISSEALKAGRKAARKGSPVDVIDCEGRSQVVGGPVFPCEQARKFPAYEQIIPESKEGDPGTFTVGLDVALLRRLADAIGSEGSVALTFRAEDPLAPILVRDATSREPGTVGIIMPVRISTLRAAPVSEAA